MNRIFFEESPYPKGHKIKKFIWSGRLNKNQGIIFDFHLESEDYYAENTSEFIYEEEEEKSDWKSKIAWENFHNCTMSSTYWDAHGILVGNKKEQLDFNKLLGQTLKVDSIDEGQDYDHEKLAFNIYLLGHDDCANHQLKFIKQHDNLTYDIEWTGNIALAYSGDYNFKHSFKADIHKATFIGFFLDDTLSHKENEELLKACLVEPTFKLIGDRFQIH